MKTRHALANIVAVLVVALVVYFSIRTPHAETLTNEAAESPATAFEPEGAATIDPTAETERRKRIAEAPSGGVSVTGRKVLRVILEGITEEHATMTTITLTGVDKRAFDPRLATEEQRRDYVRWIQESLNRVMESGLDVDGILGSVTRGAITAFQRREGLQPSGRFDPKTEEALLRYVGLQFVAPQWPDEIRASWPCQGLTSEFDLDPFFASVAERNADLRVDELEVQVDHPLHRLEWSRVALSRGVEVESGQTVYEARVPLVPVCVIHGRLMRTDGTPAAKGLVGALLLEDDFPIDDLGRAVECGADGSFLLRVPASGHYALASYEEGMRPTTTRVEAIVGTRVDVGTLELESGHAITGRVLRRLNPLSGAIVSATPPTWKTAAAPDDVDGGMHETVYEGRTFVSPSRSVHFLWLPRNFASRATEPGLGSRRNGRFELDRQGVLTDDRGAFAFRGLGDGDYLLRMQGHIEAHDSLPGYWDDSEAEWIYSIHGDLPARVVDAPERGVELGFYWTWIRFELAGELTTEDKGRLLLKTPSAHPTPVDEAGKDLRLVADPYARNLNFTPEFHTSEFQLFGNEPIYVLQAPPDKHITGEVRFPGRQPVALDFRTPKPGGELEVPVDLLPVEEAATLVLELENSQAEIPEAFSVKLWRAGQDDFPPDTRPVEVAAGQLRVEDIFPGRYRVRIRAGEDHYSAGLFHEYELELELHPGQEATRSILMPKGAGLRFTVRNEDGVLLGGEYEFSDDLGLPIDLNTYVRWEDGHAASSWKIYPHGTHESYNELHPGRYRLVLRSPGYAERIMVVELRAGEYEEVDVILSK